MHAKPFDTWSPKQLTDKETVGMSDIFVAIGTGALILAPVFILVVVAGIVAVKRGEASGHH